MDKNPLVSFVIATYNREKELKEAIESILKQEYRPIEIIVIDNSINNASKEMIAREFPHLSFLKYQGMGKNLGAAVGKNEGIKLATGEIIVIMDDDSELSDSRALENIVNKFSEDQKIGLLSLKSVNYFSGKIDPKEFPSKDKSLDPDKEFETSYFVGVGHAVRKEAFQKAGLYPKFLPVYGEELDLSFRLLDAGYRIIYFPEALVLHKVSLKGRITGREYWKTTLENRIRTSIRNLPMRYVIVSSIIWTLFVLYKTGGNLLVPIKAYENVLKDLKELKRERKVLTPHTINRIKDLNGRLLY
jgi:GT2 family glycosyltransferase